MLNTGKLWEKVKCTRSPQKTAEIWAFNEQRCMKQRWYHIIVVYRKFRAFNLPTGTWWLRITWGISMSTFIVSCTHKMKKNCHFFHDRHIISQTHNLNVSPNHNGFIVRTLRSDDGDGNRNATKAIGFISKTTILHVHHAFLYISLPSLHDYDVKMPNFTIWRGSTQATTKFPLSFWTWIWFLGIQL